MPVAELERVIEHLSPENYEVAVKFIVFLSETQKEGSRTPRRVGLANGEFEVPENIDGCNEEIASLFEAA